MMVTLNRPEDKRRVKYTHLYSIRVSKNALKQVVVSKTSQYLTLQMPENNFQKQNLNTVSLIWRRVYHNDEKGWHSDIGVGKHFVHHWGVFAWPQLLALSEVH